MTQSSSTAREPRIHTNSAVKVELSTAPADAGIDVPALPIMEPEWFAQLMGNLEHITYAPGAVIIQQDAAPDRFYILEAGEVDVVKVLPGVGERPLARLKAGDCFGEIGLVHGIPRTATVRAAAEGEPVAVLALDRESFATLMEQGDITSTQLALLVRRRLAANNLATALPHLLTEQVERLVEQFTLLEFNTGDVIIREGDPADRFYIIAKGQVEVVREADLAQESYTPVAHLGAGEFFGEIGLLQARPRTATVRATQDGTLVMALDRDGFQTLLGESKEAGHDLIQVMYKRLLELNTR